MKGYSSHQAAEMESAAYLNFDPALDVVPVVPPVLLLTRVGDVVELVEVRLQIFEPGAILKQSHELHFSDLILGPKYQQ